MSREKILAEIKKNKPTPVELPSFSFSGEEQNKTQMFLDLLHSIGGKGEVVDNWQAIQDFLQRKISEEVQVVNGISKIGSDDITAFAEKSGSDLEEVGVVFLEGELGVAENSAIWVKETKMVNRMLPFICQELVLVIKEETIVSNMHDAYSKLRVDEDGYGVFIAGPSKTADIEQSLVIGAHGPLSLQVFILKTGLVD